MLSASDELQGATAPQPPLAIRVQDVSITYRTTFERTPTMKDALMRLGRGKRVVREVEAVKNVSFDVPQGSIVGIIGHNGAGKSTMMRALAGIMPPTSGRIEVRGQVSTLLALGVGFNGQLSGKENVLLGGLAAGLTRAQVAERYEEISEFAELGDFMEMPMKTYSSGMYSRLAFAVAVHMDPDILLVDEALSAGDASFRHKANAKMQELLSQARTMVMVSHALGSITDMCSTAIWLDHGTMMMQGTPEEVVEAYTDHAKVKRDNLTLEDV
ncbi:MAG: teichoic acid transport system ATP-binding protein [Frankiaceae bacterium]|nr:teichoic acid transport system ATP-binding protein [Frankiaceae bacterium]